MLLSLPLVLERLQDARGWYAVTPIDGLERRLSLAGVRLLSSTAAETATGNDMLYIADEGQIALSDGQPCPKHLLLVRSPQGPTAGAMRELPRDSAVVESTAPAAEVLDEVAAVFQSFSAWDARMLQAIVDREGVDAVLSIAAEKLANPIALFDPTTALVARAGTLDGGYEGTIWEDVIEHGFSPIEFYSRDERAAVSAGLEPGAWPVLIRPDRTPDHVNLFASVTVDGRLYGSIGQVDLAAPFTPGQIALAEHVRNRLQECIALSLSRDAEVDELSNLVVSIVEGRPADTRLLAYYLGKRGWNVDGGVRMLLCPCESEADLASGTSSVAARMAKAMPKAIVIPHGGAVICLVRTSDYPTFDGPCPTRVLPILEKLSLTCAVSDEFRSVLDAARMVEQCRLIVEQADRLSMSGAVPFESVFEPMVADRLCENTSSDAICHPAILDLARRGYKGDLGRGRELIEALYRYLSGGQNMCACARGLYMHRNTLAYRIGLLEELLDTSFSELGAAEILRLELSCLIALRELNA